MKESNRQKKMGKLILKEMSEILQRDFLVINGSMLTIHQVRVTGDLGIARLYISVFPDARGREAIDFLSENKGKLRRLVAQRIRQQVRHIPELQFYLDDTLMEVDKMDQLLSSLLHEGEGTDDDQVTGDPMSSDPLPSDSPAINPKSSGPANS